MPVPFCEPQRAGGGYQTPLRCLRQNLECRLRSRILQNSDSRQIVARGQNFCPFCCRLVGLFATVFMFLPLVPAQTAEWPDIRSVAPDLAVPGFVESPPAAGLRVRRTLDGYDAGRVYHTLHLPTDWAANRKLPVLVEYAGNGGYRDVSGDECSGRPESCSLGYGISGGQGLLWICLPCLNNNGTDLAITWWGNAPEYDPQPTLRYCRAAVEDTCANFGGDRDRVILCGFSRGAIACNYLGLNDDQTAQLWCAFVPFSHYDGVRRWPYPDSDAKSAADRLARLNGRPQFIIGEKNQAEETQKYLMPLNQNNQTFASTGFRNHNDQWILRPGSARDRLRVWLNDVMEMGKPE